MRPNIRSVLVCCGLLVASACGGGVLDAPGDAAPAGALVVTPGDVELTVLGGVAAQQAYTAALVLDDGSEVDVTSRTRFVLSDGDVGYFAPSSATLVATGPGRATVAAMLDDGRQADAVVEVFTRDVRVGDGAPTDAPDLFDAAVDAPERVASIVYPADRTIVPPNLGDFDVHWTDASGSDLFEVRLRTYYADVRVYLATTAAAGAWTSLLTEEWLRVARSERGATINVTVRGISQAAPGAASADAILVHTTREDIAGGLYYWASANLAGADGIFRHDLGRPGEPAEPFYTRTEASRCVACHVLSPDGTKMAITYDGGNGAANIVDVATRTPMLPADAVDGAAWNFATFHPTGAWLLTARTGALQLRDATTNAVVATPAVPGYATHPDFSPTGDQVVYVDVAAPNLDWSFTGGSIVTQTYQSTGHVFGGQQPLVVSAENNYYPSFSPDGEWVLFNRAAGNSYDAATAELWVVKADGSAPPLKLSTANVGAGLTNSWARWAPFQGSYGVDAEPLFWLTFSSKRDFGVRLVGALRPQLWMTPFFPERAAAGADPTAPAFRLPFQDLTSNNHIAQWTQEIVPVE